MTATHSSLSEPSFPFAAIVGQDDLKLSLLLNLIDPSIGGVLIQGEKGTAKSTASRGLVQLLPPIQVQYNTTTECLDPYNREFVSNNEQDITTREIPTPFVDLSIGATEDRVLGSLNFSATLRNKHHEHVFQPGLLAAANRGITYIDEVNLLPPHLVDVLLDAAASGVNVVQREGMTIRHDAKFILIGTMNPEEGTLRPQLLDRFGLMVEIAAPRNVQTRAQVVRQRIEFERDKQAYCAKWEPQQQQLQQQIQAAKALLPQVTLSEDILTLISTICTELNVSSLRADITLHKASTALAAWNGCTSVQPQDVKQAAPWVLSHRRGTSFLEKPQHNNNNSALNDAIDDLIDKSRQQPPTASDNQEKQMPPPPPRNDNDSSSLPTEQMSEEADYQDDTSHNDSDPLQPPQQQNGSNDTDTGGDGDNQDSMQTFTASKPDQMKRIQVAQQRQAKQQGQFRGTGKTNCNTLPNSSGRGYYIRSVPTSEPRDIALDATLRAAALSNGLHPETGKVIIKPDNWRRKVCSTNTDSIILFVVDSSGSMSARQRMEAVKGTVLALLKDAYRQRNRVGVISFRGTRAEMLLEPTTSVQLAEEKLQRLATGGRTPLAHALSLAHDTIQRILRQDSEQSILVIVLSDGKANVPLPGNEGVDCWEQTENVARQLATLAVPTLILDTDMGVVRVGRAKELSALMNADYLQLEELNEHTIRQAVGVPW